jgi:signal transduction histidine kinase
VWVEARDIGDAIRIEVRDDGPGIADKHRERVFERFYRADPSRAREAGGTGLGLSIVKHLVESMNGAVGVEPNTPRGSIFWLRLPKATNTAAA